MIPRALRPLLRLFVLGMPLFAALVLLTPSAIQALVEDPIAWLRTWFAWASFALYAPFVIALAVRFPIDGTTRMRAAAIHFAGAMLTNLTHTTLCIFFGRLLGARAPFLTQLGALWSSYLKFDLLVYGAMIAAVAVQRRRARARRTELAVARLESRAARASFDAVRGQLEGKPILDALASIESDLERDSAAAESRLEQLAASLRAQLERIRNTAVAPRTERRKRAPRRPLLSVIPPDFAAASVFFVFAFLLNGFFVLDNLRTEGQDWLLLARVLPAYAVGGLFSFVVIVPARRVQSNVVLVMAWLAHASVVELALRPLENGGLAMRGWGTLPTTLILSAIVTCAVRFDALAQRQRNSRLTADHLTRLIAEARLRTLRTNIAPHFLFNTLNSILTLVRRDPPAARLMIDRLRRLLRVSFEDSLSQEVTLREELEITNAYIDIERVRFRDALDVRMDVEHDLLDARVPSFLLQPLVENAIRHGILGTNGRGRIHVTAERHGDSMQLAVQNDGEILDPDQWRDGIGLSTTRARLAYLYGTRQELAVHVGSGVEVKISLPCS
ncbi:MAG TPA: histidine kinase [Thermoanaerobaculia bacterium]|nr:histidine kinase [Thermoanaerobaculia bacterium]